MLAYRLRHRVAFQWRVEQQNKTTGEVTHVWEAAQLSGGQLLDKVPAEVLTGPGRELIAAQAPQAETTARINLRWFPGLNADWRVLWDGRVYNIRSIETDITGRREWRLRVEDGVNEG